MKILKVPLTHHMADKQHVSAQQLGITKNTARKSGQDKVLQQEEEDRATNEGLYISKTVGATESRGHTT